MSEPTTENAPKLVPPPEAFGGKSPLDSLPRSPKLPPEPFGGKSPFDLLPKAPAPEQERDELDQIKDALNDFPADLRKEVKGFFFKVTQSVMAHQTHPVRDVFLIEATPKEVQFYKDRFTEILDSRFLDRYENPPKKIT